jgi:hypothetical protein
MDFASRANRVKVDPALMLQVIRIIGFPHDHPSVSQDQMGAIVKVLQNVDLADDERSMAAASISFRLEALTALILTVRKHNWPVPKVRGQTITAEALTRCASEEALTIHRGRPAFDPESFGERLRAILE